MESKDVRRPIALLVAVLALLVVFLILLNVLPRPATENAALSATERPIPSITPAEQAQLEQAPTFAALVSYTDRGFEPSEVTIEKGETVRFTNNSSKELWVAATGAKGSVYPAGGQGCGSSAFDSCTPIEPGDFWQFTFNVSGTWSYQNNLNPANAGVVEVK